MIPYVCAAASLLVWIPLWPMLYPREHPRQVTPDVIASVPNVTYRGL